MSGVCYICGTGRCKSSDAPGSRPFAHEVTCPRCGIYQIADKLLAGDEERKFLTDRERLALGHAIRRATDSHGRFAEAVLSYDTGKELAAEHPLPDPIEQADLLIDFIARHSSYGELTPPERVEIWAARIGLKGALELKTMCTELERLIGQSGLGASGSVAGNLHEQPVGFSLKLEGWSRAREIRQQRGPGNQAFIAMWFHPEMDAAFDDGFAPALLETSHKPYRVDRDAHNNKIDDQIVAELRRSKLVIVDTTGARPNAYFEAGFAMGLGIPVLWCCNGAWETCLPDVGPSSPTAPDGKVRKWKDLVAFDTRQHPFIFWDDPADLRKKLTDRIRALGFDASWNRQ